MEITSEIKNKVFAQYLGQPCIRWVSMANDWIIARVNGDTIYDEIKVILKPLANISDEEARVVANMSAWGEGYYNKVIELFKKSHKDIGMAPDVYQFLQSKGYDLPNFYLGGKTLHEAGLAIYPKDI